MNTRSTSPRVPSAFTLLEILAVITIIAILMAILSPVIKSSIDTARREEARHTESEIVAAVTAYQTEYAKLPTLDPNNAGAPQNPETDAIVGDAAKLPGAHIQFDNSALFNTLRAINSDITNPKRIVYMTGNSVANPDLPKTGFLDKPGASGDLASKKGCLFDPWGTEYFVVLDTNYDNQLDVSAIYQDFSGPDGAPRGSVAAFSLGLDRQVGSPGLPGLPPKVFQSGSVKSDDVLSWR